VCVIETELKVEFERAVINAEEQQKRQEELKRQEEARVRELQEAEERREQQAAAARAADAAAAAAARRERRLAKAATLPAEPAAKADSTRVLVRLPNGQRLNRCFPRTSTLQAVVDWVESSDPDIYELELVSSYPKRVFSAVDRDESLEALGLHPDATLFTKELQPREEAVA